MAKGPLRVALEDFIETFGFGRIVEGGLERLVSNIEGADKEDLTDLLDKASAGDLEAGQAFRDYLLHSPDSWLGRTFTYLLKLYIGVRTLIFGGLQPIATLFNYDVEHTAHSARPDPSTAYAMLFREPGAAAMVNQALADQGWTDEYISLFREIATQRLPEQQWLDSWRRGLVTDSVFDVEMKARGYTDLSIDLLKKVTLIIPGAQDLVQFAVRDAFNPEAVQRFGYDEGFPEPIVPFAEQIGLSRDWLLRYWRAHWQLPSPQLGFEMLHRLRPGITDTPFVYDDLLELLKIGDIPAYFRDKIAAISYQPYTRVDVRRMFEAGVLTEDDVHNSYLDLGYDDEHAANLTAWTVRDTGSTEKGLTRSLIVKAYKSGVYSRDDTNQYLSAIGYNQDAVDTILALADLELAQDNLELQLTNVHDQYVSGVVDASKVYDMLGPLNLPATQVNALLDKWDLEIARKVVLPSRSELDNFYRQGIITAEQYQQGLRKRHYTPEAISWYEANIDRLIAQDAAKALQDAEKAQSDLQASTLKSAYQVNVAELNVQIASLKVSLADIKVALASVTDPTQATELKTRMLTIKQEIANLMLHKAELKSELEQAL